jgi:hypothetical protein
MQDTLTRGTGPRANWNSGDLRSRIPIAGKTGTSQGNRDLGFVGFTPYFTAAVWMGNDNNAQMHRRTNEFHTPLWRHIMQEIHIDLPARSFDRPGDIVTAVVCRDSGLLPTEYCRTDPRGSRLSRTEVFASGRVPTQHCNVHQRFAFCTESGQLACQNCPDWSVVNRVGLVRTRPVPEDTTASIQDRHLEFPADVRLGITCEIHSVGGIWNDFEHQFGNWGTSEIVWDIELGQWIEIPQNNFPTFGGDQQGFVPGVPPVTPEQTPTPPAPPEQWGFGGVPVPTPTPTEPEAPAPFVNSVAIPGLD